MARLFKENSPTWRFIKKLLLFFVLFGVVINAFSDTDNIRSLRQHWNRTQLTWNDLDRLQKHCVESEKKFLGCTKALETVLRFLHLPVSLSLEFGKNPKLKLIATEEYSTSNEKRQAFFRMGLANAKNFKSLFENIKNLALPNSDESLIVGLALNAWLSELDPHSGFLPKDYVKEMESGPEIDSSNLGIGLNFKRVQDQCIITNVLQDSPAELIGLEPGDIIETVENLNCATFTSFQISEQLQKTVQNNIPVEMKIIRKGLLHELTISPKIISQRSVEVATLEEFSLIKVRNFYETDTCEQIEKALIAARDQNRRGIILDLRNNPGGYLEEISCTAGLFLGNGVAIANFNKLEESELSSIYDELFPSRKKIKHTLSGENFALLTNHEQKSLLPLVIAINHATASSAEILAGAIKEYRRGFVVGATSFGKGTSQTISIPKRLPRLLFTESTHRITLPSGAEIQKFGVKPQFESVESLQTDAPREGELFPNALDPKNKAYQSTKSNRELYISSCFLKEKINSQNLDAINLAISVIKCQIAAFRIDSKQP